MQGLSEILNSTETTCSLKISRFCYVLKGLLPVDAWGFMRAHFKSHETLSDFWAGLVTFSRGQTNLTVCSRGRVERCWKEASIGVG